MGSKNGVGTDLEVSWGLVLRWWGSCLWVLVLRPFKGLGGVRWVTNLFALL